MYNRTCCIYLCICIHLPKLLGFLICTFATCRHNKIQVQRAQQHFVTCTTIRAVHAWRLYTSEVRFTGVDPLSSPSSSEHDEPVEEADEHLVWSQAAAARKSLAFTPHHAGSVSSPAGSPNAASGRSELPMLSLNSRLSRPSSMSIRVPTSPNSPGRRGGEGNPAAVGPSRFAHGPSRCSTPKTKLQHSESIRHNSSAVHSHIPVQRGATSVSAVTTPANNSFNHRSLQSLGSIGHGQALHSPKLTALDAMQLTFAKMQHAQQLYNRRLIRRCWSSWRWYMQVGCLIVTQAVAVGSNSTTAKAAAAVVAAQLCADLTWSRCLCCPHQHQSSCTHRQQSGAPSLRASVDHPVWLTVSSACNRTRATSIFSCSVLPLSEEDTCCTAHGGAGCCLLISCQTPQLRPRYGINYAATQLCSSMLLLTC